MNKHMKKKICVFLSAFIMIFLATSVFAGQWVQMGTKWQYIDDDGTFVVSSWKLIKVGEVYTVYYFDESGNMSTGLKRIGDEIYAFRENGSPISNSKIIIDDEEYETKARGRVEGISLNYDIDAYNARLAEEKKEREESIAAVEAEKKRIEESIANRTPEELALIAASEAAEAARLQAIAAAEEAARQERIANTIKMTKALPDAVTIKGEENGKVTVSLLVPVLEGGNAAVINQVLADKIKKQVYLIYEEKYGSTRSKLTFKVKNVYVTHDLDRHLLTFRFVDTNYYGMFTLYMDTITLEMWSDG